MSLVLIFVSTPAFVPFSAQLSDNCGGVPHVGVSLSTGLCSVSEQSVPCRALGRTLVLLPSRT